MISSQRILRSVRERIVRAIAAFGYGNIMSVFPSPLAGEEEKSWVWTERSEAQALIFQVRGESGGPKAITPHQQNLST
jgi:hypothetical protein